MIPAVHEISPFAIVPSRILSDVILPVPIVVTPALLIVTSPEAVTNVGIPEPLATRNCPEVPADEAERALVPFP